MRTWNHMLLAAKYGAPRNALHAPRSALHVRLLTKQAAPRYARELANFASSALQ
jgi:hypothetical protein